MRDQPTSELTQGDTAHSQQRFVKRLVPKNKMNICKFALAVFVLELCAGIECAYKHNWKMAGVWTLYSLSNLLLAFVNE
jgi:hypothetical protein